MTDPQNCRLLAKLSWPTVGNIFPRTRLYQLWGKERKKGTRILWLSAPGGSGKTLAVADYLRQRKLSVLWYQLDAGDGDPASFFHYLGQAVDTGKSAQLPLLAPEYVLGLPIFTHNYFRALSKHLKTPGVIVFDNYQDLPDTAAIHELLPIGIAELPAGITVLVLSRGNPPTSFSRWHAHGELRLYDWEQLRLTEEENTGLCQYLKGGTLNAEMVQALYDRTKGWIAGLALLLESDYQLTKSGVKQDVLFDYFAHEIFSRAESATRDLLLQTAVLPEMTMDSIMAVTGYTGAQKVIEDLCRRNFFITHHGDNPITYAYHPLFREYLLSQADRSFNETEKKVLRHKAAQALVIEGKIDFAIELYLANEEYTETLELILKVAETIHYQGRDMTLNTWLSRIPVSLLENNAWGMFWSGIGLSGLDPNGAVRSFEKAFELFKKQDDVKGMYRVISGVCYALHFTQQDQSRQDIWIQRFIMLDQSHPLSQLGDEKVVVLSSILLACYWRDPTNIKVLCYLDEAISLWEKEENITERIKLGNSIVFFLLGMGELQKLTHIMQTHDDLINRGQVTPLIIIWHYMYFGFYHTFVGNMLEAERYVGKALQLAEDSGIYVLNLLLLAVGVHTKLLVGDVNSSEKYLKRMQQQLADLPLNLDTAHYHLLRCWQYLWQDNARVARAEAETAIEIARQTGARYPISLCLYGLVQAMIANNEDESARKVLHQSRLPFFKGTYRRRDYENALSHAYLDLRQNKRDSAIEYLRAALQIAIEDGYGPPLLGHPDFLLAVFGLALEERIEVPYVQKLIRIAKLSPSLTTMRLDNWPYPLKLYTLGRFSVLKDDTPLVFSGKAQKKPMELLKALVAFGGREVAEERLAEALWPDAEGDAAHSSLRTTLHRLRKLLGNEAVLIQEGRLTLDRRHVWVDVWAVERLISEMEPRLQDVALTPETLLPAIERLKRWYQGLFLAREAEAAWMLPLRERLRSRVMHLLRGLIGVFSRHGDCERVIELYETALQLDDLDEALYRGLMACHAAQGRRAKALALYERCTRLLREVLRIEPSPPTVLLRDGLRANDLSVVAQHCEACRAGRPH